jgi:hypothetical protein
MERVFEIEQSLDRVVRAFRLVAIALSDCEGDFSDVAYLDECAMTPEAHRKARAEAWDTVSALLPSHLEFAGWLTTCTGRIADYRPARWFLCSPCAPLRLLSRTSRETGHVGQEGRRCDTLGR